MNILNMKLESKQEKERNEGGKKCPEWYYLKRTEENVKNLGRECWEDGDIIVSSLLDHQCKEKSKETEKKVHHHHRSLM